MLQATIIGYLGADAAIKQINDKDTLTFSVATTKKTTNTKGEKEDVTTWVSVSRAMSAESKLGEYLKKGTQVYVSGSLSVSIYENNNKERNISINLFAQQIELLSSSAKNTNSAETTVPIPEDLPF